MHSNKSRKNTIGWQRTASFYVLVRLTNITEMNVDLLAKCTLMSKWRRFVDGLFWMLHQGDKKRYKYCLSKKNAHRLPGSQPVMSLWTAMVVHIHKKYLRTQNIHSIKKIFKDYKNLDKRNFTSQQRFLFCFFMFFFSQSLGDEYPLRFSLSQFCHSQAVSVTTLSGMT